MTNNDTTTLAIAQQWALSEAYEVKAEAKKAKDWATMSVLYQRAAHMFTLAGSEQEASDCRETANLWSRMAVKYQN